MSRPRNDHLATAASREQRPASRHVFGRAPDGYRTLAHSPDLSIEVSRALACFEFGESVEWIAGLGPLDERHLRFVLRPIAGWIALTRIEPGPLDPSREPTLVFRSLLFADADASWVVSHLGELLRDTEAFAFRGDESTPVSVAPAANATARPRSELVDSLRAARTRRATLNVPRERTSLDEIVGVVATVHAREGEIPIVVVGPGSDSLACDLRVVDPGCRRGRERRGQIEFGEPIPESANETSGPVLAPASALRFGRGDGQRIHGFETGFGNWDWKGRDHVTNTNERIALALLLAVLAGLTALLVMVHGLANDASDERARVDGRLRTVADGIAAIEKRVADLDAARAGVDANLAQLAGIGRATQRDLELRCGTLEKALLAVETGLAGCERSLDRSEDSIAALPRIFDARLARAEALAVAASARQRETFWGVAVLVNRLASGVDEIVQSSAASARAETEIDRPKDGRAAGKQSAPGGSKQSPAKKK